MVAPVPADESYASRFTAPLTVDPRATKVKSLGIQPARVLAIVGALVLVAALVFLVFHLFDDGSSDADGQSATPATAQQADQDKLQSILPEGYVAGSCTPAELSKGALAKVSCTANADPGGPPTADYTLVADTSALRATFDGIVRVGSSGQLPGQHSVARAVATQCGATARRGHGVLRFPRRRARRGLDRRRGPAGQLSGRGSSRPESRSVVHVVERPPVAASPHVPG